MTVKSEKMKQLLKKKGELAVINCHNTATGSLNGLLDVIEEKIQAIRNRGGKKSRQKKQKYQKRFTKKYNKKLYRKKSQKHFKIKKHKYTKKYTEK